MATPGNTTSVPAASTAPMPTGTQLTVGEKVAIGSSILALFVCLFGANVVCRVRRWRRRRRTDRPRRPRCPDDDPEQGIPLRPKSTCSADPSQSSAEKQLPGCSRRQETRHDDPAQRPADECQEVLTRIYTTTGSYVQMLPWVDDDQMHIMDIYTKLQLEKAGQDLKGGVKSYWDIFRLKSREGHPILRAILRGWAGLGKTTLLDKIAYHWAYDGIVAALGKYKLVFVLKMHSLRQTMDVMDALFDQLLDEENINRENLKSFIKDNPDKVLFLLDGFDEFKSTELDEKEFGSILKMLNRKGKYEQCSVLVTTRPSHYDKLVQKTLIQKPFALVNVLGFSKDDIKEYVHKFFSKEPSKASGLLERITFSNVLSDLATSPMLLLLMCLLWRETARLPDTMFRLYNEALRYIFKRKTNLSTEEISRLVIAVGKVAWGGLLSSDQKLLFQEEEFKPDVLNKAIRAGILTSERVVEGMDPGKNVYFIHKTFQEFCAAKYYQSITPDEEIQTFLRELPHLTGFEYLLRFCCGDRDGPRTNSILEALSCKVQQAGDLDDKAIQVALNCYFESQGAKLPPLSLINCVCASTLRVLSHDHSKSLLHFLKNIEKDERNPCLKIRSLELTKGAFQRLGAEFVNHVNKMVNLERFVVRDMGPSYQAFRELVSSISWREMTKLQTVSFLASIPITTNKKLGLEKHGVLAGACLIWRQLGGIESLKRLHLEACGLTINDLKPIAEALRDLPNLVELSLSYNKSLNGSGRSWCHLEKIKSLKKLHLNSCGLTANDLENFAEALRDLPNLVELGLSYNKSLNGSGRSWCHLEKINSLKKLHLNSCGLTQNDLEHFADALPDLPNIVELSLNGNNSLARSSESWCLLKEIKSLETLSLEYCGLTQNDLEHITKALRYLPNLVELSLSDNESLNGSGPLWCHLKGIKSLKTLNLSVCELTKEDLEPIAEALRDLPNLVELDLSCYWSLAGSGQWWCHLKDIKSIKMLCLSACELTTNDLEHIAEALRDLPNLVELDLSDNESLAGSGRSWYHLKKIKSLQTLILQRCGLTNEDREHIAEALGYVPNLKY